MIALADGGGPGGEPVRELLRRLETRHPALARWMGGPLEVQAPAVGVSLAVHLVLIATLALITYKASEAARQELTSRAEVDTKLPAFNRVEVQDLDKPDAPALSSTPVSSAPNLGSMAVMASGPLAPTVESRGDNGAVKLAKFDIKKVGDVMMPAAPKLAQNIEIRGIGTEQVGDVEGAVDHIAVEILRRLERGRTLVVWAFDASGSLVVEREGLGKHIAGVYNHIRGLDKDKKAEDDALLTAVVAFGNDRKVMTPPTSDPAAILSAIKAVPIDKTGIETTFTTVADIVKKYHKFKDAEGRPYHAMVIVVTDEIGDDQDRLEDAIATARAGKTPIYILGSSALFGRIEGRMNYTDPETKQVHYNLPVNQGPESVVPEVIRLPFWYDGPQYEFLDAGFGPYALSRMAGETGGIYFVTRLGPGRVSFNPNSMREYRPDWVSKAQYEQGVMRNPLRQAVLEAASITQQNLPGQPSLSFPAADDPEFKDAIKANQVIVARVDYTVKEALVPISAVSKLRDRETSRRWQAHYDLIRGRLLAMRIRCNEFNSACAQLLRDQPKFKNPGSNTWKLVPADDINARDSQAKAVAAEAHRLLKRVVDDHPGTPWALLAQREMKDPFGFKWVEANVPPRPKRMDNPPQKKAKPAPQAKPTVEIKL
jgi:hypothetical protein